MSAFNKPKKFIRHRDLKLKDKEVEFERSILRSMSQGTCPRCADKLQWKFQYDKYKPLKRPGTCQDCKQRNITKAYRTLCDNCATKRKVCASCCVLLTEVAGSSTTAEKIDTENSPESLSNNLRENVQSSNKEEENDSSSVQADATRRESDIVEQETREKGEDDDEEEDGRVGEEDDDDGEDEEEEEEDGNDC